MKGGESMRLRLLVLLWLAVFVSLSGLAWAEWYQGTVHGHSLNSDGTRTASQVIGKAEATGDEFLIQTDHYDILVRAPTRALDEWHIKVYRDGFATDKLVCLVGAEFAARHGKSNAHIFGFGQKLTADDILSKLNGKQGVQQQLLDRLHEAGFLTVAAHPNATKHLFDWGNIKGLDGIEFFNDGSAEGYQRTLAQYLALVRRGEHLFVTAGCDQHTPTDPDDKERWTRKTYVWIDGPLTEESLLEALRHGQTYAARGGVRLSHIEPVPGGSKNYYNSEHPPRILAIIHLPDIKSRPRIRLYRDNIVVADVASPAGPTRGGILYKDDRLTDKLDHRYILEVENYLVASPVYYTYDPTGALVGK